MTSAPLPHVEPDDQQSEAFRWTSAGGMQVLPGLPADSRPSAAVSVSADGSVIAGFMNTDDGLQAFRWTAETGAVGIGFFPGGIQSHAFAVSADGSTIVGWGHHQDGIRAFHWTAAGGMQNLGLLAGCTYSQAVGVSADGSVVVGMTGVDGRNAKAFRWTAATGMQELAPPEGNWSVTATAVSADGNLVIGQMSTLEDVETFIWDATNGVRTLRSILEAADVDLGAWRLDIAMGISADGTVIAGQGLNPDEIPEAWRVTLPAP